ncbi:hypothetical protein KP509_21G010900 [Ceratopteris richardii]|uniref:Uncharacterized protein n=1 Tax=Ceratopteris richardii TaxID=49495 RepID=A0A8T2S7Q6_CERRI|nr:hypothetical protein KP509_21G010900 [Ceratopteris richardii]
MRVSEREREGHLPNLDSVRLISLNMQSATALISAAAAAATPCGAAYPLAGEAGSAISFMCAALASSRSPSLKSSSPRRRRHSLSSFPVNSAEQDYDSYDGRKSVFSAEAYEEFEGDEGQIEGVGPELKGFALKPKQMAASDASRSDPNVEYVRTKSKTMFPAEVYSEAGGELLDPVYQKGVSLGNSATAK